MKNCLVILSGWAEKDKKEKWISSGLLGDNFRIIAAKYLWDKNKNLFIIVSGGKGQLSHIADMEPLAQIMAKELVELGIDRKIIIKESRSYNTYEQMIKLAGLIKKYKFDHISIISNKWHLPRIKALIENIVTGLKPLLLNNKIKLLSAEKVLLKNDQKKWGVIIKKIYANPRTRNRIKMEKQGIKDILNGKYKITHQKINK